MTVHSKEATLPLLIDEEVQDQDPQRPRSSSRYSRKLVLGLGVVIVAQLVIIVGQWLLPTLPRCTEIRGPTGQSKTPYLERLTNVPTAFFSDNETASSEAWEAIEAGHGLVTVPKDWARSKNLEDTMDDPSNPLNSIYFVAAYHDIHCLQYLRRHFFAFMNGQVWQYPQHQLEHSRHCFDALRQSVMCTADDTLLHTFGNRDVGHGRTYMCRNWDTLRDWATERTVCYHDQEFPSQETRWGHGDGGQDGLPRGSVLG